MAQSKAEPDFLDEMIEEFTAEDPAFPGMFAEAVARREMLRALSDQRKDAELTQTATAAAMGTSQSAVGKLETSASDALISTVQRYAKVLGMKVQMVLLPEDSEEPAVVVKRGQPPRPNRAARPAPAVRGRYAVAARSASKTTAKATRSTSKRTTAAKATTAKKTTRTASSAKSARSRRTVS